MGGRLGTRRVFPDSAAVLCAQGLSPRPWALRRLRVFRSPPCLAAGLPIGRVCCVAPVCGFAITPLMAAYGSREVIPQLVAVLANDVFSLGCRGLVASTVGCSAYQWSSCQWLSVFGAQMCEVYGGLVGQRFRVVLCRVVLAGFGIHLNSVQGTCGAVPFAVPLHLYSLSPCAPLSLVRVCWQTSPCFGWMGGRCFVP